MGVSYSGWVAFFDYFRRIGIDLSDIPFAESMRFVKAGVWNLVCYEGLTIVSLRPSAVQTDAQGRLHSESGPAIAWSDGYEEYAYHGVWVPEGVIMRPGEVTFAKALGEPNVEVRWAMTEIAGLERLVAGADPEVLDSVTDRAGMPCRLLRIARGEPLEPVVLTEVTCPSTGRVIYERVPPATRSYLEACAWQSNSTPELYAPVAET